MTMMSAGFAQQKKKANPCDSGGSQMELNNCAAKEYRAADAALNKVYERLMSNMDDDYKAKLKNAELAWIKYRDANCECEAFINLGGANGAGLGASHQTGWTGCIAALQDFFGRISADSVMTAEKDRLAERMAHERAYGAH